MKNINLEDLFKQILKFNLPSDYPDELINAHILFIKHSIKLNEKKIKSIIKKSIKK